MGIDWYVLSEHPQECFEMGGGAWGGFPGCGGLPPDYNEIALNLLDNRDDREEFAHQVAVSWFSGYIDRSEPDDGEWLLELGRDLWDWCSTRCWHVKLVADSDDWDPDVYKQTGTRYKKE